MERLLSSGFAGRGSTQVILRTSIALVAVFASVNSVQSQVYEKVYSFNQADRDDPAFVLNRGSYPSASLVLGTDGNLYGTTSSGGTSDRGTVFRLTRDGLLTTLVEFTENGSSNKGSYPAAPLTESGDGNFYGTTTNGGSHDCGTLFRMSPTGNLTTLVEFTGNGAANKGSYPETALIQAVNGDIFGTTAIGGAYDHGTIFKVNPTGELTTLIEFSGDGSTNRGSGPAALILAGDGNFYGITQFGGLSNAGTAFRVTPAGDLTTLFEFNPVEAGNHGGYPMTLVDGGDGHFYGINSAGGVNHEGAVFRLSPDGSVSTVINFEDENALALVLASDGSSLYLSFFDRIMQLSFDGVITNFSGQGSGSGIVDGGDGYYYGTTSQGGSSSFGTVFRISPVGTSTVLLEFGDLGQQIFRPEIFSRLVEDGNGNLYGALSAFDPLPLSAKIFRLSADRRVSSVVEFAGEIFGDLVMGNDGNIYGIGTGGGLGPQGLFRATPSGLLTQVAQAYPNRVLEASDGNFYATSLHGGTANFGTLIKITPSGVVTTLVEFTGNSGNRRGRSPMSGLVEGSDGSLYGTTWVGGQYGFGSIFKLTPAGEFTTLVEFSGNSGDFIGKYPEEALIEATDGFYYGTTRNGGSTGFGSIFKISPSGQFTHLHEFSTLESSAPGELSQGPDGNFYGTANQTIFKMTPGGSVTTIHGFGNEPPSYSPDGISRTGLTLGSDGNLYGTTQRSIFRLVFSGSPSIAVLDPATARESAVVQSLVNPRGSGTSVVLEYGHDGTSFPNSKAIASALTGFKSKLVGTTIPFLEPGSTYYFRFRAANPAGVTYSEVQSFSTLVEPNSVAMAPSVVGPVGAVFAGQVDAQNRNASVTFEYGTDGNSFPHSVPASPSVVTGNTSVPVSAPIAGLTKGTTYYYRVVATNAGGTSVSGTQSFRTLTEPVPSIGGSFALGTTSVRVEGSVDPEASDTNVVFEYGTDGTNFPNSVAAVQGAQSGSGSRPVSAVLTNLAQGVTYHYRIRAVSDGGVGVSPIGTFSMNVLSGFTRVHPGAPPESEGFLTVNLFPAGLLHGWRFLGEQEWRLSGVPATGLATGDREIEFRPVNGYLQPPAESVDVVSGVAATVLERNYYETEVGTAGTGGLNVTLKPDSLTSGPDRAQWRLLGEDDNAWRDSGVTVSSLIPGAYLVELKPVPGRATPPNASVLILAGQTAAPTVTYFLPDAATGAVPSVLAFETVTGEGDVPYAHVGQLRSRSGAGTGFVVKPRVVATAAHVVWDDGTLSAAQGLQWMFQRHRGLHDPKPLQPRGFYLYDGYAAQRTLDNSPGDSSPESQNLDVAAIYFNEDAARGGYGGFLASDLANNEFLLSNANKMLVGYPLDGVAPASRSRMHATAPFNVRFDPAFGRTFTTTDLRSFGGNSGGPMCVQFEGGAYYPAAIYLGGNAQTVVRAIDSTVIELFNRAEVSGNGGGNNTGGGITHTGLTPIGGAGDPGALRVVIEPAGAITAGAGWRLRPETNYRNSGDQRNGLNAGRYTLELAQVDGFQTPASLSVLIKGGQLRTLTFTYALPPAPAAAITLRGNGRSIGNGDTSPSALDGSDFGLAVVDGGTSTRSFTISNPGTAELSLGSIALGGSHPDDFSLSIPPGASIPPGGSTTFTILFDPSAPGTRSATVSFATNVNGSNPFTFAIQGNDTTDSDSDGFTDVEEDALAELLARFTVGQSVDLDISFIRLGFGQVLELLNLPPGLSFDPNSNRITGRITAKAATPQVEIRKRDGATVAATLTHGFPVFTPPSLTISSLRRFPATPIGRRSRPQTVRVTNAGELPLTGLSVKTTGRAARDFPVTQPAATTLAANASTSFTVTFRPRKTGTRGASITFFSNTAPKNVPVSGTGK